MANGNGAVTSPSARLRLAMLDALEALDAVLPRRYSQPGKELELFCTALHDVDPEDLPEAVTRVLRTHQYFPTPKVLLETCTAIRAERVRRVEQAAAAARPRWTGPIEAPCPVCAEPADIEAAWCTQSQCLHPGHGVDEGGHIVYVVHYPPRCACWGHVPRTRASVHASLLTAWQREVARASLPPRPASAVRDFAAVVERLRAYVAYRSAHRFSWPTPAAAAIACGCSTEEATAALEELRRELAPPSASNDHPQARPGGPGEAAPAAADAAAATHP